MSTPPGDASVTPADERPVAEQIPTLAALYDAFAHALDPFDPVVDKAEETFNVELMGWYDNMPKPKPSFADFRKAVIVRCKRHLNATEKHTALPSEASNLSEEEI